MQTYVKHLGYKNTGKRGSSSVKAHTKYMEQRKNELGEREKRELYNHENEIDRIKFFKEIDNINSTKGVLAHKLVISMDKDTRDAQNIDLKELTRRTINKYEQKNNCKLKWIACNHEGKNPHSHIIILGQDSNKKKVYIMQKHLRELKRIADKERKLMYERNIERLKIEQTQEFKQGFNIDKQLSDESRIEQKFKKELAPELKKDLNKEIEKSISHGLERSRGFER